MSQEMADAARKLNAAGTPSSSADALENERLPTAGALRAPDPLLVGRPWGRAGVAGAGC